jgi:DNA (cytosine-5)-methyltransferase 1
VGLYGQGKNGSYAIPYPRRAYGSLHVEHQGEKRRDIWGKPVARWVGFCHHGKKGPCMHTNEFALLKSQSGLSAKELAKKLGYSLSNIYRWDRGEGPPPRDAALDSLRALVQTKNRKAKRRSHFTFIDLFAGIGGLRRGFDAIGGHCVFSSEWNKFAQQTYAANFRDNHPIAGDITKIDTVDIPDHDLLLAGFPCQPFSIAGVSKKNSLGRNHGFACEAQGTLFFDVARILRDKRPAAFMLENVKNLQSHDRGRTFAVIIKTLTEELGYKVFTRIIDAKHFLPQHRERIVIVGFRDEVSFTWNDLRLPEKGSSLLRDILHPENGTERPEAPYTTGPDGLVADKYTLTTKLWQYLKDYAAKHKAAGNGFGYGLVTPNDTARTLSARYYKDGSEILVSRGGRKLPRRLTPRECARLMGYPDDFKIPVSDTQAYKQFGNSVAVPVFCEVARIMQPHILSIIEASQRRKAA